MLLSQIYSLHLFSSLTIYLSSLIHLFLHSVVLSISASLLVPRYLSFDRSCLLSITISNSRPPTFALRRTLFPSRSIFLSVSFSSSLLISFHDLSHLLSCTFFAFFFADSFSKEFLSHLQDFPLQISFLSFTRISGTLSLSNSPSKFLSQPLSLFQIPSQLFVFLLIFHLLRSSPPHLAHSLSLSCSIFLLLAGFPSLFLFLFAQTQLSALILSLCGSQSPSLTLSSAASLRLAHLHLLISLLLSSYGYDFSLPPYSLSLSISHSISAVTLAFPFLLAFSHPPDSLSFALKLSSSLSFSLCVALAHAPSISSPVFDSFPNFTMSLFLTLNNRLSCYPFSPPLSVISLPF